MRDINYKGSPLAREVRSWQSYLQNQTKSYITETGPTETIQYGKAAGHYEKEADLMRNGVRNARWEEAKAKFTRDEAIWSPVTRHRWAAAKEACDPAQASK